MKESTRNILALLALGGVAIFATRKKDDSDSSGGGGEGSGDSGQGCTDPDAMNYDPEAILDDGSCGYPVVGCTDPSAFNFDPEATTDDGTCVPVEYGCLDPDACNFDPLANTSAPEWCDYPSTLYPDGDKDCFGNCYFDSDGDGICDQNEVVGCTDPTADENYNPDATDSDNTQCVYYGCTDDTAYNYNAKATPGNPFAQDDCIYAGCTAEGADNFDSQASIDDGSCIFSGCTNGGDDDAGVPPADNYDPQANQDDGSCVWAGCMNLDADNYEFWATEDDGSCQIFGCTDPNAAGGNNLGTATEDDGSCEYRGCTYAGDSEAGIPPADNYDPQATLDDGSCIITGCTNPEADNYNEIFNNDDGSCIITGCTNPAATNYVEGANNDDGSCIIPGCTDPESPDYNLDANVDDGSCTYPEEIEGCTNQNAINYNPDATIDDDSCQIRGCMDDTALNWDPLANVEGQCEYAGCMNPEADNYNPDAVQDDPENPCIFFGCTDGDASNYDPQANTDDGSCIYNAEVPVNLIWGETDGVGNHPIFGYALQSIDVDPEPCYGLDSVGAVLGTSGQLAAVTGDSNAISTFISDHYGQSLGAEYMNDWWAGICEATGFAYKPLYNGISGFPDPSQGYYLSGECEVQEPLVFISTEGVQAFWWQWTGGSVGCSPLSEQWYNVVIPNLFAQLGPTGAFTPAILGSMAQQHFGLPSNPFDEFGNALYPVSDPGIFYAICQQS